MKWKLGYVGLLYGNEGYPEHIIEILRAFEEALASCVLEVSLTT